jgi:nicotinamidase-related amidase
MILTLSTIISREVRMPPVLIILDPQNDFFGSDNPNLAGFLETIPIIDNPLDFFHQHDWPIIFLQHTSSKKPEWSKQWEIYEQFVRSPEDTFITKGKQNAFEGSLLQNILQTKKATKLLFAGYLAEYCVLTTYRAATSLGYQAFILKDGTASLDWFINLEELDQGIRLIAQSELGNVFSYEDIPL